MKWKASFKEEINNSQEIMGKLLPLKLMQLTSTDLGKQFVISPGSDSYTSRELVFKFYESTDCKIIYLTGNYSVSSIIDLLSEIPPVFIFHCNLSLNREKFPDLSGLDKLNAIYTININEQTNLFWDNLNKVIETDLQFYWRE